MGEVVEKVRPLRVDMICPSCGNGRMRLFGDTMLALYPPKFPHQCNVCGYVENYDRSYPYITWEDVNDEREV